jgi:hypothetical protein
VRPARRDRRAGCPLPVASAGTIYDNDRIYDETARELRSRGVPQAWIAGFRPTTLWSVEPALDVRTLVLGMTRAHLAALRRPELCARAFLLAEVQGRDEEIADPLETGAYARAFATIAACVERLVERAQRRSGGSGSEIT